MTAFVYNTKMTRRRIWESRDTFAVLNATFLQSGRILTDQAGTLYDLFWKMIDLSFCSSILAMNATHPPEGSE